MSWWSVGGSFEDSRVNLCSREQRGFSVQDLTGCSSYRRQAVQDGEWHEDEGRGDIQRNQLPSLV